MIAVDWSHTKGITIYDGKKVRTEDKGSFLRRLRGQSSTNANSNERINPQIVLEEGCPLSLIYALAEVGYSVGLVDNHATEKYRQANNIVKTDDNDAKIIYHLANNGTKPKVFEIDEKILLMHSLYHQYLKYQKARVAMMNMKKGHERAYGQHDLSAYDESIVILEKQEKGILKSLVKLIKGRESNSLLQTKKSLNRPFIRGLGDRIWAGILVTANPSNFKNLSSYLRFCGLSQDVIVSHRYNRHAKMLYHMLAEGVMKHKDFEFRPIYDKCKSDVAESHPDYTKLHIHNAALNRTATFLAKRIFEHCQI